MPLTDTRCKNARKAETPFKISDGGGLYLLVNPDGSKYWRLAYRIHGKQRTLALGVYDAVTLADARDGRALAKGDLAKGDDPGATKKKRTREARTVADNTLEASARAWHATWSAGQTPKHALHVLRRLERDIFPEIGRRPIAEIEPREVLDALRKVEARGAHETAHRLKQTVGQIMRFAIAEGKAQHDASAPLRGALKSKGQVQNHRKMPVTDLPGFVEKLEFYAGDAQTAFGLRLVMLTLLRTTELRLGRWSELGDFDGKEPIWRVPAERMKKRREHIVPLSKQAVAVLRDLRSLPGSDATPYMFPSAGHEQVMSHNTMLYALYRLGYHGRATVHGFRGLASTILNENDFDDDWIEMQLAHVEENKVRGAYNAALYLKQRRKMMQWWADYLDRVTG